MSLAEEAVLMTRAGMYWSTLLGLAQDLTMRDLEMLIKVSSDLRALAKDGPEHFTMADMALINQLPLVIYLLQTIKHHESSLAEGYQPQPLAGGHGG